jgi:hypothetical protein
MSTTPKSLEIGQWDCVVILCIVINLLLAFASLINLW